MKIDMNILSLETDKSFYFIMLYHQWHQYGGRANYSCGSITVGVLLQSPGMLNWNRTSINTQRLIRKLLWNWDMRSAKGHASRTVTAFSHTELSATFRNGKGDLKIYFVVSYPWPLYGVRERFLVRFNIPDSAYLWVSEKSLFTFRSDCDTLWNVRDWILKFGTEI
jgi:hypothetical protein